MIMPTQRNITICSLDTKHATTGFEISTSCTTESRDVFSSDSTEKQRTFSKNSTTSNTDITIATNHLDLKTIEMQNSLKIIGVTIGTVLTAIIFAAFATYCIVRRRKSKQSKENDSKTNENFKMEFKLNNSQIHSPSKESAQYFQLEANPNNKVNIDTPPGKHLSTIDKDFDKDNPVYIETGNDVYDHLNKRREKQNDNEDMYNVANGFQGESDEYQHIQSSVGMTRRDSSSDYAQFNEEEYSSINRT